MKNDHKKARHPTSCTGDESQSQYSKSTRDPGRYSTASTACSVSSMGVLSVASEQTSNSKTQRLPERMSFSYSNKGESFRSQSTVSFSATRENDTISTMTSQTSNSHAQRSQTGPYSDSRTRPLRRSQRG